MAVCSKIGTKRKPLMRGRIFMKVSSWFEHGLVVKIEEECKREERRRWLLCWDYSCAGIRLREEKKGLATYIMGGSGVHFT